MDHQLPDMSGPETAAAIRRESPDARIVMLSVHDGEEDIFRAVQAGAVGYLHKAARRDEIVAAIRAVRAGRLVSPRRSRRNSRPVSNKRASASESLKSCG